jgi:hypothetical protein
MRDYYKFNLDIRPLIILFYKSPIVNTCINFTLFSNLTIIIPMYKFTNEPLVPRFGSDCATEEVKWNNEKK